MDRQNIFTVLLYIEIITSTTNIFDNIKDIQLTFVEMITILALHALRSFARVHLGPINTAQDHKMH